MKGIFTCLLIFATGIICAQSLQRAVLGSSGSSGLVAGFTVGEPIVGLVENTTAVDQGFWSSGNLIVESMSDGADDTSGISVYPNPVDSELTVGADKEGIIGFNLYSVNAQRVLRKSVSASELEHRIDVSHIVKGVYILQVYVDGQSKPKLFKIIKR